MEIFREFTFEAAHRLPNVPAGHKCHRLHGHSYRVELHVRGPVGESSGWLMDFADITAAFAPLHAQLDHHYLNEVEGLENPTSENLARWLWQRLRFRLPQLSRVVVRETCTSGCIYSGEDDEFMEIFTELTFEAAHRLPNVPAGHKCSRLHGHSYRVQIHVRGPVDAKAGWILDLGDIDTAFAPLRAKLDHYYLNEVEGLENPTSENLARWIWQRMRPQLPMLSRVVVRETCTSGCIYEGEND